MCNQKVLALVALTLGACVGGIDPLMGDDVPTNTPRQLFDQTVAPLMSSKCASCHVGPETSSTNMFLGPDGASSFYSTLVNDRAVNGGFNPEAATILLKGAHDGPPWSTAEAEKIANWLRAELSARGPDDPGGPGPINTSSARGASMAFVSCMTTMASVTDYNTLQAYLVANLNTDRGRCSSCHSPGGAGGQWLGITNQYKDMFKKWQEEVFFSGVFQPQLQSANRTYKIAAAENKICAKGKEKENNLGTHPVFDCMQNGATALTNLTRFAAAVQARVDARDPMCPAPAFAAPTL